MNAYKRIYLAGRKVLGGTGLSRYPPFSFLKKKAISSYIDTPGGHLLLGKDKVLLSIIGIYEPEETAALMARIKPTDVCIDVGANIGYYTLMMAKLGKEVYAFEPDHANAEILRLNVAGNQYNNVTVEEKAVSKKPGNVYLQIGKDRAMNRIGENKQDSKHFTDEFVLVETISLDSYFKDKKVDVIKMDVEGFEPWVLEGGEETLKNCHTLLLEVENVGAVDWSEDRVQRYLEQRGFTCKLIDSSGHAKDMFCTR